MGKFAQFVTNHWESKFYWYVPSHLYGEQARFFDMEVTPRIKHTKLGLLSMVNNGSGMHGSQVGDQIRPLRSQFFNSQQIEF